MLCFLIEDGFEEFVGLCRYLFVVVSTGVPIEIMRPGIKCVPKVKVSEAKTASGLLQTFVVFGAWWYIERGGAGGGVDSNPTALVCFSFVKW